VRDGRGSVKRIGRRSGLDDVDVAVIAPPYKCACASDVVRGGDEHHVVPMVPASQCGKGAGFSTGVRRFGHEAEDLEGLGRRAESVRFVCVQLMPRGDHQRRRDVACHERASFVQPFAVATPENHNSVGAPCIIRGRPHEESKGRSQEQRDCYEEENQDALSVQQVRLPDSETVTHRWLAESSA
jgi:hypothetical protein